MTMLNGEPIETPNISTAATPHPPVYSPHTSTDDSITRVLGVIGLIMAFVFPLAGIILSAIALSRSRVSGQGGGLAFAGLIVSIVATILVVVLTIVAISFGVGLFTNLFDMCQELGPGIHVKDGVTYECNV